MIHREIDDNRTREEKIGNLNRFIEAHPIVEIQDLYKWLYYGEFGEVAVQEFYTERKNAPALHSMLEDLRVDAEKDRSPEIVWEPQGFSQRYLMIYLTPYYNLDYPLMRVVNLIQRSSAFQGYRMRFKLDWILLKDEIVSRDLGFTKQDFINFEDRIQFHQLPELDFSDTFKAAYPVAKRIVATKLFFEYFPEFAQEPKGFTLLEDVELPSEQTEEEAIVYARWEGEGEAL